MTLVTDSRFGLAVLPLLLLLTACAGSPPQDGAPDTSSAETGNRLPPDPVPRPEPRSRYGNPAFYEVYGVRYEVMDSSYGYQEKGVASWYGTKFHGKATSSQEPYDMHAMTAAHKTLPLPTYVRVRNLKNNRSVIVRVNDRGPFIDNRIIDLSYSAAMKLDMVREGTTLVEVTALSFDEAPKTADRAPQGTAGTVPHAEKLFVQVGAFGNEENAKRRYTLLRDNGITSAFVHRDGNRTPPLYRIRIGPISGVEQYDRLVARLGELGVHDSHLVSD